MHPSNFLPSCLLALALAAPAHAQAASACGDCNGDGVINILDALTASQHSTGLITVVGAQFVACNPRGVLGGPAAPGAVVDILDALAMAQAAAGISVAFDCDTMPACAIRSPAAGATTGGDAILVFDATDLDEDPQTITWEYSTDGGATFALMSVAPGSAIATNPGVTAPGAALTFAWDSEADLVTPGGLMAYLPWGSNPPGALGQMSIVDIESQTPYLAPPFSTVGQSTGVRVSEELGLMAATDGDSSVLWVVDLRTGVEIATVPLMLGGGMQFPRCVAFDEAGRRAFVAHAGSGGSGGISEVDLVAMTETAYVSVPGLLNGVEYDSVQQRVYVSTYNDAIAYLEAASPLALLGEVSSGLGATARTVGTDIDPGNRLYAADFQTCRLLVWDISGPTPVYVGAYPVPLGGAGGYEVDLAPGGEFLYLTQASQAVFRFDVSATPCVVGSHVFSPTRTIADLDVAADGRVFVLDERLTSGAGDLLTELSPDLTVRGSIPLAPEVTDLFGDFLATPPAHQVLLRLTTDDGTTSVQCTVDPVAIDTRPMCSGLSLPAGPVTGVVPITADITDHSVEMVTVTYQYDTGAGFLPMTAAAGVNPVTVAAGHTSAALPAFSWDSLADIPMPATDVQLRVLVEDGAGHLDIAGCLVTRDVN